MAEKAKETAIIIDQKELLPGIFDMWVRTEKIAKEAKAGQFVSVYCHDGSRILPRPISICEIDKEDGQSVWYTVLPEKEPKNFPKCAPACTCSW